MALVFASTALRFLLILERPLWFDELFTIWAARLPLPDLLAALRLDSGPPGFYVLAKPFALLVDRLAGGDLLVRAPSLIAVSLLFAGVRTLEKASERFWYVLLLSCSLLVNLYGGEARSYAVLSLLCLALFRLSLFGEQTGARLCMAALVAATALYTHYLAILAVVALLILTASARRWFSCLALALGAALFAPWVPVLRVQPVAAVAWMREAPAPSAVGFLSALGGVGRAPAPFGPLAPAILYFAGAAVALLSLGFLLAQTRRDRAVGEAAAFVLLVLIGALAVGLSKPIAFAGRTELAVLPVWIWGLARAAPAARALRPLNALSAALGLSATLLVLMAPHPPSPPLVLTETLTHVAGPGDIVIAATGFYLPARLASEQGRLAAQVRPLNDALGRHPGWFVSALPGPEEESRLAAAMAEVAPGKRLFFVLPPVYATANLARVLSAPGGRVRELMRSPDALVVLWTRSPGY